MRRKYPPSGEAAEIGTRKVIADHSTIGVLVTTDGSIGEIPEKITYLPKREVRELERTEQAFCYSTELYGSGRTGYAEIMQRAGNEHMIRR